MSRQTVYRFRSVIIIVAFALLAAAVGADTPQKITVQGRLLDAAGDQVPPGTYDLGFRIFDQSIGGTLLWGPEIHSVTIDDDGLWTSVIGSIVPIDHQVFYATECWLELRVNDGINPLETLDRVQLTSTPFAHNSQAGELIHVGGVDADGAVNIYSADFPNPGAQLTIDPSLGGRLWLWDDQHNTMGVFDADVNGTGAYFQVNGDESGNTFAMIDGNFSGTGSPAFLINGVAGQCFFRTDVSGNEAAFLPQDAIYDAEILDEPGIANVYIDFVVGMAGGEETVVARSITLPTSGYVMAFAHGYLRASHTTGTSDHAVIGIVRNGEALNLGQDVDFNIPSAAGSGNYDSPFGLTCLFSEVAAGTYTYEVRVNETSGFMSYGDVWLNLLFVPTSYGATEPRSMTASMLELLRVVSRSCW